ncbi:catalase family protein [Sabulicella rubraurantiaca]|uniref:catalase family protein n=1 Tax=Sabulicella rubraurantiaca TaxID=2811429 RepID=UPI001A973DF3|nr:catalase family protein [Sabulicella rubraurantiaca]
MSSRAALSPLRYEPSVEEIEAGEKETEQSLIETMRGIQETTFKDYGHALRSVHAKSHALLEGELRVLGNLPPALAQGIFARRATYPVILRLSTNPGDILDDDISSPRGLAVKVIGVEGERLEGSEGGATQDFVMANAPAFGAPGPKAFAGNLSLLAASTDTGQAWKKAFSAVARAAEGAVEAVGGKSMMLTMMGGHPLTHLLGETFYTQSPFRHGEFVAKLSIVPVSRELVALKNKKVDLSGRPNGLREEAIEFFRQQGGEWEVRVQLRTNAATMPIEDASVTWPEEDSPYLPVARITVPPQPAWSEARARIADDGLSFSPWNGIAAHQPLGGVNRARRNAYREAAQFRSARNGCPLHAPQTRLVLPDTAPQTYGTAPGREGRRPNTPDARPGAWTQPMSPTLRHALAGAAGGLAAGAVVSALFLGTEAVRREPSDLVKLQRKAADRAGLDYRGEEESPSVLEELAGHGGHLALSTVAGAAYGATVKDEHSPLMAGLAFGLGFHALAFGVVGPALGLTPPPWRDSVGSQAKHAGLHVLYGVMTGVVAERVARRM